MKYILPVLIMTFGLSRAQTCQCLSGLSCEVFRSKYALLNQVVSPTCTFNDNTCVCSCTQDCDTFLKITPLDMNEQYYINSINTNFPPPPPSVPHTTQFCSTFESSIDDALS